MIDNKMANCRNRESGQASMVTVAMFMMLFAVIAVSFTYIVVTATRQATNDSLQASAKAAAESGVEDAKRLLTYCYNHKTGDNTYNLSDNDANMCRKVVGNRLEDLGCTDILKALDNSSAGSSFAVEDGEQVKVGTNENEYYQCLKIATKSTTYVDVLNGGGSSSIVPLKLVNAAGNVTNPTKIVIEWHRNSTGEGGDQMVSGLTSGSGMPNASTWNASGTNRPAVLRVEQVGASKGTISIGNLIANDSAVTLRPSTGGGSSINITSYHPKYNNENGNDDRPNDSTVPLVETKCSNNTSQAYACSMNLNGTLNIANYDFYLRLNAIYKNTHFSIKAYSGSTPLYFDGVQPVVDVTGKSADSFNRVQARLEPVYDDEGDRWWPEYAIDTEGRVCKDMNVYYENGVDNCN